MKKTICLLLLLSLYRIQVCGQTTGVLCERIYLQTDKQLYLAGECVHIKALTTTPERIPLSFSKIVYVELLDTANALLQIKIGLTGGVGEGWMILPSNLTSGYYRLIAYTRHMRNESPGVFLEKTIGVVNTFQPALSNLPVPSDDRRDIAPPKADRNMEQNPLPLTLSKPLFACREEGWLRLEGIPDDIHTLSVAITGKSPIQMPADGLLQWYEQVKPASESLSGHFIPEYEGHIVTGQLTALEGHDNPGGDLRAFLCIPGVQPRLFSGVRNHTGVTFYLTDITDVSELITITSDSSNNYRIDLQSPFIRQHPSKQLPELTIDSTHLDELLKRSIALQLMPILTKDLPVKNNTTNTFFNMEPTKTYLLDEYSRFPKMDELILEFVLGVRFRMRDGNREIIMIDVRGNEKPWITPLVLLDGIPIKNHELIYRYNPLLVERIDIFMKEYLFGGVKYDGILSFSTYKHNYPELKLDDTYRIFDYAGTQAHYTPLFTGNKWQPDFRHTLLWNPAVHTAGKSSVQIPFHTSDYTGDFTVTVEGITKGGIPVYATASFIVK